MKKTELPLTMEGAMRKGTNVIYTPDYGVRLSGALLGEMWRDLKDSRELGMRLMVRDLSAQYRQSVFGIAWAFVPPIATALLFIVLAGRNVVNLGTTSIPYPVFALFGTVLWQIFVYSLNAPLRVVSEAKPLLSRIRFPREALMLSCIGQALFNAAVKLVILAAAFIIFQIPLTWGALYALAALLVLVVMGITFGLCLTPLGMLYSDVSHGLSLLTTLWFFITPVVYPPPTSLPFSLLAVVNPVSPILLGARQLATEGMLQNPLPFFVVTVLVGLLFMVTWVTVRLTIPILIERISA